MGLYIKKLTRIGSIGPNEERGFGMWAGYDIVGVEEDLDVLGLIRVDGWTDEQLGEYGVTSFATIALERLGIARRS